MRGPCLLAIRRTLLRTAAWLLVLWPAWAAADPTLLQRLELRIGQVGADAANAELLREAGGLDALRRRVTDCEFSAVSLALRLGRTRDARAAEAHTLALREANGRCTRYVLALARADEVPRYCGSLPHWGPAQTARELRRRMGEIDADALLRSTGIGRACKAAYLHELQTTRVVVRRAAFLGGRPTMATRRLPHTDHDRLAT